MISRAGFTLIEAMVGLACALIVLLGAVAFAHYEMRTLGISRDNLEMTQVGRMSLDLLLDDLANAGAGIGYNESGQFAGFEVGQFTRGSAVFSSNGGRQVNIDHVSTSAPGTATAFPTDDIGLIMADGQYVTVTYWTNSLAQVCAPSGFSRGDTVVVRSEDGISARSVSITSANPAANCINGVECSAGCEDLGIAPDTTNAFVSGPSAPTTDFTGGTIAGGFKRVTWFVSASTPDRPQLRRLEGDCAVFDDSCGDVVADNVDTLQMRIFERVNNAWVDRTDSGVPVGSLNPLRVDVEIVMRADTVDVTGKSHPHARMVLEDRCLPGPDIALPQPCTNTTEPNMLRRLVLRASTGLLNAGKMRIN